jgi:hypothetical protein
VNIYKAVYNTHQVKFYFSDESIDAVAQELSRLLKPYDLYTATFIATRYLHGAEIQIKHRLINAKSAWKDDGNVWVFLYDEFFEIIAQSDKPIKNMTPDEHESWQKSLYKRNALIEFFWLISNGKYEGVNSENNENI